MHCISKVITVTTLFIHGFHFADNKIAMHVEAALCEVPSKLFHGVCIVDSNCARICEKEGYLTGKCKGMLPKCICLQDCGENPPPEVPPPEVSPPEGPPVTPHPPQPPVTPPDCPPNPPCVPIPTPSPPFGCLNCPPNDLSSLDCTRFWPMKHDLTIWTGDVSLNYRTTAFYVYRSVQLYPNVREDRGGNLKTDLKRLNLRVIARGSPKRGMKRGNKGAAMILAPTSCNSKVFLSLVLQEICPEMRWNGIGTKNGENGCRRGKQRKVSEYYKKQERLLEGFNEMEAIHESGCLPDTLTEDEMKQLAKSERMAVHVSNVANLFLFIAKVYASVASRSLAGIIVFASVMATLGLQTILESVRQLPAKSGPNMNHDKEMWMIGIMVSVTVVKFLLMLYCRRFKNEIVRAYAQDHFFDVITNSVGLATAVLAIRFYWWIDPTGAILVQVLKIMLYWSGKVL
ncbi:cation efflux family protein [Striga asiatica]|uniref:Cation efflux family protein n=1 Tax=Striga asiatica TaxID=4170 RepID=A0A5A7R5U6_STRAF|nr:cation efflux family protein [Striga asiatica]